MALSASETIEWRLRVYPRALILLLCMAMGAILVTADGSNSSSGSPAGGDFPAFFSAGSATVDGLSSADLYNLEAQQSRQTELIGSTPDFLPFAYPPQVALAYAPLTLLPYRIANFVNFLLMLAAVAVALGVIRPMVPAVEEHFALSVMLALAFGPLAFATVIGQNVAVTIMLMAVVWRSLVDENEVAAGIAVGLLMFRPQYGVPLLGLLLVGRHIRAVGVATAATGLVGVVNTIVFGPSWVSDWLGAATSFVSSDGSERSSYLANPYGFFQSLFGAGTSLAMAAAAVTSVAVAGTLVWLWWDRRVPLDLLIATSAPGLVLVSLHSAGYDASLLLFPVVVLINRGWSKTRLIAAVLIVGIVRPIYNPGFSTVAPALMVMVVIMAAIAISERRQPHPQPQPKVFVNPECRYGARYGSHELGGGAVTQLRVVLGDITNIEVDAVVNAANSALMGGGGVDGAIHSAGGPEILAECGRLVAERGLGCPAGDAVVTGAGRLPARWVIHTVGPIWDPDHANDHSLTLASAYRRSLEEADGVGARSVAFPNISTGVYGFPKPLAAEVAFATVSKYIEGQTNVESVVFVCFGRENFELYVGLGCET